MKVRSLECKVRRRTDDQEYSSDFALRTSDFALYTSSKMQPFIFFKIQSYKLFILHKKESSTFSDSGLQAF